MKRGVPATLPRKCLPPDSPKVNESSPEFSSFLGFLSSLSGVGHGVRGISFGIPDASLNDPLLLN